MNNGNYDEESAQDQPIVEELAGDTTAEIEIGVEATGVAPAETGGIADSKADAEDETRDAAELQEELAEELDALIDRVQQAAPDYTPPPYSPRGFMALLSENLGKLAPIQTLEKLRSTVQDDLLDPDTWRGVWYVVNYMVDSQAGFMKRRMRGDYDVDEWGYDEEWVSEIKPFFDFLYFRYWRVQASGLENIPEEGRALLAANHSGQMPWDGAMVAAAVMNEHPAQRLVRTLYASWFPTVPFLSTLMVKMGNTLANEDNGIRLLEQEQLVAVYPEGVKGVSKLYKDRYRLARFGRGGFVQMAIRTQSPIIPVSVVGAEETYISLYKSDTIAKLFGLPFFPITLTWPWLGLLGFVPLPTRWSIDFGAPIPMDEYQPEDADNFMVVSQISDQVRNIIQQMVYKRLILRNSVFSG